MENTHKSGQGCFIAVGIAGVIAVILIIAVFFLLRKAKNVVEDYADAFGASPEMIEEAKSLNEQYPLKNRKTARSPKNNFNNSLKSKRNLPRLLKIIKPNWRRWRTANWREKAVSGNSARL